MRQIATIPSMVRLHAEDAAFLFVQRRREIEGQDFDETDLGRRDQRLSANLDGLIAAGQAGWDMACEVAEEAPGRGEIFTLAALALVLGEDALVDQAVQTGLGSGRRGRTGLSGAVARTDAARLGALVTRWLGSADAGLRWLGLAALSHHRADAGGALAIHLGDPDPPVRARAARLAGEVGRQDLLPRLAELEGDPDCGMEAGLARLRLGARDGMEALEADIRAAPEAPEACRALDTALLANGGQAARDILSRLMKTPETHALALSRTGVTGDRTILDWLLREMEDPDRAVEAGFAFRDLVPVNVDDAGLFTNDPDRLGEGFAGRDPGAWPIAANIAAWMAAGAKTEDGFHSLRRQMLDALRVGLAAPGRPLANWRATRRFPAWL